MAWNLPWTKTDPLSRRQQELAQLARELEEQARFLEEQMAALNRPAPEAPPSLPVWSDATPAPRRVVTESVHVLQAHRRRDRNLFILLVSALVLIILWLLCR